MPGYVSSFRSYILEVKGAKDLFHIESFVFTEALSQIPVVRLRLLVENAKAPVAFADYVGETATLHMEYRSDSLDEAEKVRTFEGIIRSLVQGPQGVEFTEYQAELVPKLWAASQQLACRSWEKVTFGDIIQRLITEAGLTCRIAAILAKYQLRWYCQYEESTLDFISRVLEQEGVAYYFDGASTNRFVTAYDSHEFANLAPQSSLKYLEDVTAWERCQSVRPTRLEVLDWSYRQAKLISGASGKEGGELPAFRRHGLEYPLPLDGLGHGQRMADVRLDEARADRIVFRGTSFMHTLAPGHVFTLTDHFSDNGKYLVVSVTHRATAGTDLRSGAISVQSYENEFVCIPETTPYRPPRVTPRPRIPGIQPAVVTNTKEDPQEGPTYCRVKVKFSWGRSASDPIESDWLRVTHPWASTAWGFQFQPRVNDEVLVAFENGDPNRAVVVGGVYNFSHQAPWPKTWQEEAGGIRSQKGNELIFFDKPTQEAFKLYAKREYQLLVEEDSKTEIKRDLHLTVGGISKTEFKKDFHQTITGERRESVTGDLSLSVTGNALVKSTSPYKLASDSSVHISGGMSVVIEAGTQLTLKVGSSSVDISPAGVAIQGPLVRLNSGGSAGSCQKPSPKTPLKPSLPDRPGTPSSSSSSSSSSSQPGSQPGKGGGGSPPPGSSPSPTSPVVQERMAAPSFRQLLTSIGNFFSGGKKGKDGKKKEPPPVTTGLGLAVDEMVAKSPTLTKNLETLQANGWTIEYGEAGKGSYCDRNAKKIVVDENEKGSTASVVQTLAHESGHAMYTPDPYVPPDGLSKEEYVAANVKRDLRDEGEATITNLQVRDELLANGEEDIGVAGAKAAEYQKAFDACDDPNDPTKRDALRTQIGGIFEKGEHPSTDPTKTYGDYYAAPYAKFYDENVTKH